MKKVLIIGATSAIAHSCARLWAKQGAGFFLVARSAEKLAANAADLTGLGANSVATFTMDATDSQCHKTMLEECVATLSQIDILLIAHGTLPDQQRCEQDVTYALQEFENNCTSVIALLTLLAGQFEKQRCGTMAVISSVAGDRGRQSNYLYGSAKAAISAFCEGLRARMFKLGVHVMTIKPGFVDTPMTQGLDLPKALLKTPDFVAKTILEGIEKRRNTLYTPGIWAVIMLIIRGIPGPIFKRLSL